MERLLGVKQLAELLGVSKHSIYAWVAQGRVPFLKLGTRTLFRPDEVQRWVREQSQRERGGDSAGTT